MARVYWANALFSQADRAFNALAAQRLRSEGFDVVLPQESAVNTPGTDGSEAAIFRTDTSQILRSDAVVVCLDQDPIDAGVACEIGIAYAAGIPMIGLYTDFRRTRPAHGRMYKNLYVLGCLHQEACSTIDAVVERLKGLSSRLLPGSSEHYAAIASSFDAEVDLLEAQYTPRWTPETVLRDLLPKLAANSRVLEIGCGTGRISGAVSTLGGRYLGFDACAAMIAEAVSRGRANTTATFTAQWADVRAAVANDGAFELLVAQFVLHHMDDRRGALSEWRGLMTPGAVGLFTDITRDDLGSIVRELAVDLALPIARRDRRPSPHELVVDLTQAGYRTQQVRIDTPSVQFASPEELDRYFSLFGIYRGLDLPLGLQSTASEGNRGRIMEVLRGWTWPIAVERDFVTCVAENP